MDIKNKKEEIQKEFGQVVQMLNQLITRKAELEGQFKLLEEMEKDVKKKS